MTHAGCFSQDWLATKHSQPGEVSKLGMLGFEKPIIIFILISNCLNQYDFDTG